MIQSQETSMNNDTSFLKPPPLHTMIIGLLPSILLNGVLVFVLYQLVKQFTSASDVTALFISAIPAMIGTIVTLMRQRSVDVLGAFSLISIGVSICLTFLTGDVRLFQLRESLLTGFFGVVCLISLFFPKPLWYYVTRYFITGNKSELISAYDAAWHYPMLRKYVRDVTILWGVTFVAEFFIRLVLIYTIPLAQYLVVAPFILYGLITVVTYITLRYAQTMRARADQSKQAVTTPPAEQA